LSTIRFSALITAAALLLTSAHAAQAGPTRSAVAVAPRDVSRTISPEAAGFDPVRLARMDAYMQGLVDRGQVAGVTTLLARHGRIVSFKSYGRKSLATGEPMTHDTIFRMYSMTKPVTAVAMMMLFEEGKWRLDDPISRYLPEFKNLKVFTGVDSAGRLIVEDVKHPPTMRELMSHSAGFSYGSDEHHPVDKLYRTNGVRDARNQKELIDRLATIPLFYQPGTSWRYSISVDIQGAIVERLSGQRLGDFLEQRLFRPLKMTDSAFYLPSDKARRLAALYEYDSATGRIVEAKSRPGDVPSAPPDLDGAGGGLISTTMDYARFAQMLANGGELDGVRILSPAAIEIMGANVLPKSVLDAGIVEPVRLNEAIGFGMDVMVVNDPRAAGLMEGKGTINWNGAGGTQWWYDPQNDLTFIFMIQRLRGGQEREEFATTTRTLTYQALTHPER
jgi:CubicO group peptidase (beta-lactamase class C family)